MHFYLEIAAGYMLAILITAASIRSMYYFGKFDLPFTWYLPDKRYCKLWLCFSLSATVIASAYLIHFIGVWIRLGENSFWQAMGIAYPIAAVALSLLCLMLVYLFAVLKYMVIPVVEWFERRLHWPAWLQ